MKRSARMEKIVDINAGFENIAGATLAAAQSRHLAQINQLDQLKIYKKEYQEKLKQRMSNAITSNEIHDYQYFFASLDQAITHQISVIQQSAVQVETSKQDWLDKKNDVSKLTRAVENIRQRETLAQEKREQNESDELNQLLFNMDKKKKPNSINSIK